MSDRSLSRRNFLGVSAGGMAIAAAARATAKTAKTAAGVGGGKGGGLFPKDFTWGVAMASYQVEGAAYDDGKGPSVWDVFCKKKGVIFEGDTGDVACDHYHRYKEDVALMKALGVKGYRFSVSWPRVLPEGIGASNPKGVDFYSRLVDELLKAGIEPLCTVFHWDYPQALYKKGGWLQRDSAEWFAEYTSLLADKFSDRIKLWATQNEPQCFIGMALLDGVHAPGDKLHFSQYLTAAHNGMRAHAKAVQVLRARARDPKATKIGYVTATQVTQPATDKPEDVEAARASMFTVGYRGEWNNTWWMDPVLLGRYPDDGVALAGKDMPKFKATDLDEMKQPLDWLGLNIYKAAMVRRGADGKPETLPVPPGYPRAGSDWEPITPGSMYWGPRFMYDRYKLPLAITRERPRDARPAVSGRQGARPATDRLHAPLPGRAGTRHQGRRAGHRLLRVVAARQLRVGRRLQTALRPGVRRLPEPEAGAEGLVRLVQETDRDERQGAGRQDRRPDHPGHAGLTLRARDLSAAAPRRSSERALSALPPRASRARR